MTRIPHSPRRARRAGAAAVELAVLLPLLGFLCAISIDFARIFYSSQTVANCARNGALWAGDSYIRADSRYSTVEQAALADAPNLNDPTNPPTVTQVDGVDEDGRPYVEVKVKYKFKLISRFIGIPATTELTRTVRSIVAPPNPRN